MAPGCLSASEEIFVRDAVLFCKPELFTTALHVAWQNRIAVGRNRIGIISTVYLFKEQGVAAFSTRRIFANSKTFQNFT